MKSKKPITKDLDKNKGQPNIQFDKKAFHLCDGQEIKTSVRWESIKEVFAFKRDLFSYDIMCLGFRTDDDGSYFEVDEEFTGYRDLCEILPEKYPGIMTDWFSEVALPAFKTNLVSLWGEPLI